MITTVIVATIWIVVGFSVLAAPVLDLIVFGATLPHRFAAWRARRAAKEARHALEALERDKLSGVHDRDWHA